ncbi:MAG: four-carbon acid sugar kinase family protein [Gammaproteobacteria bacterium]|nr:four-carbon acid sugar kinase family protein [Gammaproteobacteria bacterium]
MSTTKIIVLDDDPTGSQTVHSCLLLMHWDEATLREALNDAAPLFFILTNTRAMDATQAAQVTRAVCRNLRTVLDIMQHEDQAIDPIVVSRSDSTLRGHYPVENDVIAQELGPFDAHFLVPAFFEAGRVTRDSVHYLRVDAAWVPVHQTEFARDSIFAYQHSYLPDYVEEKTQGRIRANQVQRFTLADLRGGLHARLRTLNGNVCCVVDAEQASDLDYFCAALKDNMSSAMHGKRFLFRSAASLLTSLAQLPPQPVSAQNMGQWTRAGKPGAVIVGSHVTKTTAQLNLLLQQPGAMGVELDVDRLPKERAALLHEVLQRIDTNHHKGLTSVVYTSRLERSFATPGERFAFGAQVAGVLMDIEQQLPRDLGFLISKGGITSNDTLSTGLALRTARLLGQILPGVSMVCCPANHPRYPDLPVVIFPGNVGDENALATVYNRLSQPTLKRS